MPFYHINWDVRHPRKPPKRETTDSKVRQVHATNLCWRVYIYILLTFEIWFSQTSWRYARLVLHIGPASRCKAALIIMSRTCDVHTSVSSLTSLLEETCKVCCHSLS
jgi:hypothetical protein